MGGIEGIGGHINPRGISSHIRSGEGKTALESKERNMASNTAMADDERELEARAVAVFKKHFPEAITNSSKPIMSLGADSLDIQALCKGLTEVSSPPRTAAQRRNAPV